jgi:cell division protein FtsW
VTQAPLHGAKERRRAPHERKPLSVNGRGFAITFLVLLVFGLVVLYAASYYNAQDQTGNPLSEVLSQLQGVALGAVMMLVISRIDYRLLRKPIFTVGLLALSFVLLGLVAIPGVGMMVNGSRRWLRIGPVGFQPSEMAKYAMILFFARALSRRNASVASFWKNLAPLLTLPLMMFLLILMQPNLSTAGAILIVAAVMVMLAGAKWSHLLVLGAGGGVLGAFYALSEPYRRARLMSFRNPFAYLSNEGYQLAQSLLAFGSGGLFGMGLGKGRQKFSFLPYPESDFIFAVAGEDMGLFGCILILALFLMLIYFGFRIAIECEDRFGSLLAAGIVSMIGVQTVMNVAVVIGLMPTTGLPLPFFSAGGTSISILMAAVGVVLNIAHAPIFRTDIV